jgi:DNA polymerase III epsilon subunit-like protein
MKSNIVIFDFETTHIESTTDKCDIVEIGAVTIDPRSLTKIEGSEFFIEVRPDRIDEPDYYTEHKSTIDWHLALPQNKGKSVDDMMQHWAQATPEKMAYKMFSEYVNTYNYTKTYKSLPIPGGQNIKNFDLNIYRRLCAKHKIKEFFSKRDAVDTLELSFYWFMFNQDPPRSYKMDDIRPYLGIETENGHNALADVLDEAEIALMYLKQFKKFGKQLNFRNYFRTTGA